MTPCSCTNGCRPLPYFHELLRQLGEAHDAEIRLLKEGHRADDGITASKLPVPSAMKPTTPRSPDGVARQVCKPITPRSVSDGMASSSSSPSPGNNSTGILLHKGSSASLVGDSRRRGTLKFAKSCSDEFGAVDHDHEASQHSKKRKDKAMNTNEVDRATSPLSGVQMSEMTYSYYQRLCYIVDTWISKRRSQGIALAGACFLAIIVFGLVWTFAFPLDDAPWRDSFFEGLWVAWTFMADPGTHAGESDQARRIVGAMIAAVGILFMSAMLGMVVDVIRDKMEALRQGKSSVAEREHTLILGWTEKAVSIIEELCSANQSAGGGTIVVLCSINKEHIEREFAMQLPQAKRLGTRVVFRTGNTMVISDLMKVGAPTARATIILANDGDPDNSDAQTLRTMLSLRTLPYQLKGHVVAEVRDIDNEPLVKMVGGSVAETLVSHDVLGRLMLMSARQPGLAKVYESLLGFAGDEFYMREWPEIAGQTFGELIERFPDAVPIGICTADGVMVLNPEPYRPLLEGEQVFVLAEDDDTYQPEEPAQVIEGDTPIAAARKLSAEKILFCGWRRDIRDIVMHLDSILQEGSEIHMISSLVSLEKRNEVLLEEGLDVSALKRVKLVHHYGNPSVRRRLSALPLRDFHSCMIFSDQAYEKDTMHADSQSLATLLLLRDLQTALHFADQKGDSASMTRVESFCAVNSDSLEGLAQMTRSCPVICEVLDSRTQKTINSSQYMRKSSDFCQTNKITAQILAMVAENRSISVLFEELLGTSGNSVNVHRADRYVNPLEEVSFWTIAKRASKKYETLIGYISRETGTEIVCLNPAGKHKEFAWADHDMIVISRSDALNQTSTSQLFVTDAYENEDITISVINSCPTQEPHGNPKKLPPESETPCVPTTCPPKAQGTASLKR